jgi:NADH-quinone oxidoreductase subunit C
MTNNYMPNAEKDENAEAALFSMADHIADVVDNLTLSCGVVHGEIELRITSQDVPQVLTLLRGDRQAAFNQLIDLTAVDYPERDARFDVVYLMLSMDNNMRMRLVAAVAEGQVLPSVTHLFLSANWAEREVWDMFGIFFFRPPRSASFINRLWF